MDHEDALRTITAMRRQEETEYFVCDYFHLMKENAFDHDDDTTSCTSRTSSCSSLASCSSSESSSTPTPASPTTSPPTSNSASTPAPCDASCRQIMFYWMIRVVDFFPTMHRETVAYAMNYFDRFLQTKAGAEARHKRNVFQLASISCLYTAVKIHEKNAVSPKFLEQLSRDEYSVKDVEQMELSILKALNWRLATPTALSFLRLYMQIIPASFLMSGSGVREEVFEIAKHQTEVAMGDYKYVTVNASTIAFCALMNALDVLQVCDSSTNMSIAWFVSEAAQIDHFSRYTLEIQRNLADDHFYRPAAAIKGRSNSTTSSVAASIGYEVKSKHSSQEHPLAGHHHSPRTVCKAA